jgi:glutathione peroxidase
MPTSIYDFEVESITGERYTMDRYRGDVLLIVNTASK